MGKAARPLFSNNPCNSTNSPLFVYFLFAILITSNSVHAEPKTFFSISYGSSQPDVPGFSEEKSTSVGLGARWENLNASVRLIQMGEYVLEGRDAQLDVSGLSIDVAPRWDHGDAFSLELRVGLFDWKAEATLFGTNAGEDEGTDLYLGAGFRVDGSSRYSVILAYDRYFDVSGSDIDNLSIGLERQF